MKWANKNSKKLFHYLKMTQIMYSINLASLNNSYKCPLISTVMQAYVKQILTCPAYKNTETNLPPKKKPLDSLANRGGHMIYFWVNKT